MQFAEKPELEPYVYEPEPLQNASLEQLNELGEDDEFADDNFLELYRQQRIDQLRQSQVLNRFGDVLNISKDQWVREVTDASKTCWVIAHLYSDSKIECALMDEALVVIANKFKYLKICRIKSTSAVENWPDANLPTLFMYNEGELKHQSLTLNRLYGKTMKPNDLEWYLVSLKVVTTSDLEENPRNAEEDD